MAFYNTFANYVGNGVATDFAIPFTYNSTDEVVVERQNGPVTYTFPSPNIVRLSAPLSADDALKISRVTDISSPDVTWQNGSPVTGGQLNRAVQQILNAQQEASDTAEDKMLRDVSLNWDAEGYRIKNVATPVNDTDAANKAYVQSVSSVPGPTGPQGPAGPAGPAGTAGAVGPTGPMGATGPQGPVGPVGPAGPQGPQGPAGAQGPVGATGAPGPAGPAGAVGPQGPQGIQGPAGATGPQGPSGADFQPDAVGLFANRGTYNAAATGFSFLATDLEQLYFKLSATSGDWSNGITFGVGPQGPAGPTGAAGPQGPQGPAGAQGPQGPAGPTGPTGAQGPQGSQGPQGPQGPAGAAGAKGAQWRGSYSAGTTYVVDDVVQFEGSTWIAILGGTGNTPPSIPTTSNTHWNLFAQGYNGASSLAFTPTGNIGSSNVQAAIQELDSEKAAASHTHAISDVTGLQTALDGKADDSEITTINSTLAAKANLASPTFTGLVTAGDLTATGKSYKGIDALVDAATIAVDMAVGNNFSVTLAGNRTLGNPTNMTVGQSGVIFVSQDGAGNKTLAYSSNWDFAGGVAPTLSTAANTVDAIVYFVRSSTAISAQLLKNV